MQKCKSCEGTYEPIQADGARYFHACPPIARVRVLKKNGSTAVVDAADVAADDVPLETVFVDRPDARNENVVAVEGKPGRPKADGKGVEEVIIIP